MKNQYITDVIDYGKYSLLRHFAMEGISVGVNWYLTQNDGSSDGKFTQYLDQGEKMRRYDPSIFDVLKSVQGKSEKTVADIQKAGIIPGALFYDAQLLPTGKPQERANHRKQWFYASFDVLKNAELIFMDPDNGLLKTGDGGKLHAEKYVLPEEVEKYFHDGHNVVYYCHKGRRTMQAWMDYLHLMFDRIPDAYSAVLTFRKGSRSSYVFLIHQESYPKFRKILDRVKKDWPGIFIEEFVDREKEEHHENKRNQ